MQVTIPNDIYSQLQHYAREVNRPMETIIAERLRASFNDPFHSLPVDEQIELNALQQLSSDTLSTIASEQLPSHIQQRMQALMNLNSLGKISAKEFAELEGLVERSDRLMLRKAEATAILQQRDYTRN